MRNTVQFPKVSLGLNLPFNIHPPSESVDVHETILDGRERGDHSLPSP